MRRTLLWLLAVLGAAAAAAYAYSRTSMPVAQPASSSSTASRPATDAPVDGGEVDEAPGTAPDAEETAPDAEEEAEVVVTVNRRATADDVPPLPEPPVVAPARDDLKRISGIGPTLEARLNDVGITTFAQLAALDDAGIDALQGHLPEFPGRVRRDGWVEQARRITRG